VIVRHWARSDVVPGVTGALIVLMCLLTVSASTAQEKPVWDHGSHSEPSPDERAMRELLNRYRRGDVERAVRGMLAEEPRWMSATVDDTVRRIEEDIRYHRLASRRMGVWKDERVDQALRGDRLHVLVLAAALQLDTARVAPDVKVVGTLVVGSERSIDRLFALRADFEANGALPWPNERVADWPSVQTFIRHWYAAAVSRLQGLVELQFTPGLIARGLARFPGDPDLLLARGSLVETRLALEQLDASLASSLYPSDIRRRWDDGLSQAERDYEQAMRTVGFASEAAVRLARVRLLKGQRERAREVLDRVLAANVPVDIRYLACLFRASVGERSGDLPAATRDYEAALTAVPSAVTPMLALGRIADEHDRSAEARGWVDRALTSPPGALDPWRRYVHGQAWQTADRIGTLRTWPPN
jgi:hypothetical protein